MDAVKYNKELDASLRKHGIIDRELFLKMRAAYLYDAASTVGWVEAKLKVLAVRLESGKPLMLADSNGQSVDPVLSLVEFQDWVQRNFPGVIV